MQFTGKTVAEATEEGLKELNLKEEDVIITVIEEPTKGLFGKLKGKAVVEIEVKKSGVESAKNFIDDVLKILDINAKAELSGTEEAPVINLIAEKTQEVIGYRGEVLDALQTLAGAIANIGNEKYKKVVVDCENYRGRREDTLISLAHKLEAKATDMRREVILEPMSPFERRIIHTALAESTTVTTRSDGKEPQRYVVIVPNDKDEFSKPYNAGRNNNNGRRGKERNGGRGGKFNRGARRDKKPVTDEKRKTPSMFGTFLGNSKDI